MGAKQLLTHILAQQDPQLPEIIQFLCNNILRDGKENHNTSTHN